jgi:hypothetical protein
MQLTLINVCYFIIVFQVRDNLFIQLRMLKARGMNQVVLGAVKMQIIWTAVTSLTPENTFPDSPATLADAPVREWLAVFGQRCKPGDHPTNCTHYIPRYVHMYMLNIVIFIDAVLKCTTLWLLISAIFALFGVKNATLVTNFLAKIF